MTARKQNRLSLMIAPLWIAAALSFAAIAPHPALASPVSVDQMKELMHEAMGEQRPLKDFWAKVHTRYGADAVSPLLKIVENERETDQLRWASLFGLARLTGKHSLGVVRKFTRHRSWIMRDAALKTIAALNAREMQAEIERALHDKALVIRTTAVDVIGHLQLTEATPQLIDALFDPINYRRDKGLWIHDHILSVIQQFNYKKAAPKLVELLQEKKDPALQTKIIATLEKLTGKSFSGRSVKEQIYLWKRNTVSEMTF